MLGVANELTKNLTYITHLSPSSLLLFFPLSKPYNRKIILSHLDFQASESRSGRTCLASHCQRFSIYTFRLFSIERLKANLEENLTERKTRRKDGRNNPNHAVQDPGQGEPGEAVGFIPDDGCFCQKGIPSPPILLYQFFGATVD
jgi:hypothetical protein